MVPEKVKDQDNIMVSLVAIFYHKFLCVSILKKELLDNGRRKNFALHYMLIFFVVLMIHRIFNGMLLNSDVKVMHGFSHIKRYAES